MNDVNDVPAQTPRQTSRRHVPTCAALFAVVGLLASGCTGSGPEQTKGAAAESQELHLQPVGAPGPAPFTASTATAESAPVQPPLPNRSGRGIRTVAAATPGLYGGTSRLGSCDVERQVNFLTTDDAKSRAFAEASGVAPEKVPEFLRGLTPVVLRADTRVTDHGFRDGRADAHQAVLQAGSAVLVDAHGMPRVRCACGNPLGSPRAAKGKAVLKGDQWNGYQPNQVIVIEPTARALSNLLIVNIADNTWIERRAGDDGAQDRPPRVAPRFDPADGIPDGPVTPEAPSDPCVTTDPNSLARTTPPASPAPPAGPPADLPPEVPSDLPNGVPPEAAPDPLAGPASDLIPDLPLDGPAGPAPEAPTDLTMDVPMDLPMGVPTDVPTDLPADLPTGLPADPSGDAPSGVPAPAGGPAGVPYDLPSGVPAPAPAAPAPGTDAPCPQDGGGATETAPGTPSAPQNPPRRPRSDRPSEAPTDLPPGTSPDTLSDLPPLDPADPGSPLTPDDAPLDPSAPVDPYGFPDQQQPTDAGQYLESA
ncbi:hypothetical protein OOK31_03535 [Streptomyces sp. NBC_00249]|uniref:DUF6777 domain-containing protein n=1 Tax=Streptomyces sp. NBC_00249 TaxID=2975690 RepID=UPI00225768D3|nr:DUF6777 domain-containing protein [Streptomyces sp. NBC_00249]MCX5192973.1 hypothetical protein [Streptomyces sp. NBC_00249]